ncbi:DUF1858 domain-containing protein [Candidatus Woesearchaeota archaeon]|nr:DUF1858 domain-containing protein [Candidatus Woesearchaeota archaeon]
MITKKTMIADVVRKHEKSAEIMFKYGLHCIGCHMSPNETLEQGCKAHGMSDEEIEQMIKEINASEKKKK